MTNINFNKNKVQITNNKISLHLKMTKIKRLHFKDLNGLRFIAFLPVFLFICAALLRNDKSEITLEIFELFKYLATNSFDFFFFLSSFLITSLAIREYKYTDKFSLKKFYIRRVLRIIPLLLLSFIFAFYFHDKIISFLKLTPIPTNSIKYYLMGAPNFLANNLVDERYIYTLSIWVVFMMLQFYFIWGIVLKFLKSSIVYVSAFFIILGIITRIICLAYNITYQFNPLSYGIAIGMGAILANILRNKSEFIDKIKLLSIIKIRTIYIIGFLITVSLYPLLGKGYGSSLIPLINSLFFGFLIMEQTFSKNSMLKLRKYKLLNRLGKISYGLLIYMPIIGTALIIAFESIDKGIESPMYKLMFLITTFVFSWIMADLSYNSYEKLFSRIKRDFKRV